jgi:hypothetical protein
VRGGSLSAGVALVPGVVAFRGLCHTVNKMLSLHFLRSSGSSFAGKFYERNRIFVEALIVEMGEARPSSTSLIDSPGDEPNC